MLTVDIALPDIEELHKLVTEGQEKGFLTYDEIANSLEEGPRVAAAMRAHPDLIRGPGAPDTELIRTHQGWAAKGGAEGLLCASGPDGIGLALKVEDGGQRAVGPALAAFAGPLGYPLTQLSVASLENSRGERVGEVEAVS